MPKKTGITPEFETLAIEEQARKEGAGKYTVPSERAVKEAKDWVDSNEK